MERTTREVWAKRVERWKDSGLSAREFAAELGVSARSLVWWKWRLGSPSAPPQKRARKRRTDGSSAATAKTTKVSPLTFVEMAGAMRSEALEIVLLSAVSIRVRPGFDDATLTRILDVLDRRQ